MFFNLLNPDGSLDENAWEELCANAGVSAARGCGQSDFLFRQNYSDLIEAGLQVLPAGLRTRAVDLAQQHGDYATRDELAAEQASQADEGLCSHGIDLNCCPAGCGDREADFWSEPEDSWYRSATDDLREILDAEARAVADTVHFALMTAVQQLKAEGLDCEAVDLPVQDGVVHHTQLRLRPAGAPPSSTPYTLDVSVDLSSTAKVSSSLGIPEADAEYWASELAYFDNFAGAQRLVGTFRAAADAHFEANFKGHRPLNPLRRLLRTLVDQFANPCQPTSV